MRISCCTGAGTVALCCTLACGGDAGTDSDPSREADPSRESVSATGRQFRQPVPGSRQATSPPSSPSPGEPISGNASPDCVAFGQSPPQPPQLSYDEGCAVTSFQSPPDLGIVIDDKDARGLIVGRWRLCGDSAYYGGSTHAGIDFSSNGRNQLLRARGGSERVPVDLLPMPGMTGVYYLLANGQFMQRGDLSLAGYASFASFDPTLSVMELTPDTPGSYPTLRYVRVEPDERSLALNTFSTTTAEGCSMVGVWDTALPTNNPPAAFAFNALGEWFGGERGADLCAGHFMYGTYNLQTRGGAVVDNFDMAPETEFELVTNIGAGRCQYWFNAGYRPTFSADCNRVRLQPTWDNCTGGRGYLNSPGDDLIRRLP